MPRSSSTNKLLNCSPPYGTAFMHYRDRIIRPRGFNDPGDAHELTFSCFRRYRLLSRDRTCEWCVEAIEDARCRLDYDLWAYVFMPDHLHLVVFPRQRSYSGSAFLKLVKEPVSRRAMQFLKEVSPEWLARLRVPRGRKVEHHFWQPGRGHDRNINCPRTLQMMIDYVHHNPVRAGLVVRAEDWKWSSAGWFSGKPLNDLRPDPIPWDWLEDAW